MASREEEIDELCRGKGRPKNGVKEVQLIDEQKKRKP